MIDRKILCFVWFFFQGAFLPVATAQESRAVNYHFVPQLMYPMGGGARPVTPDFMLQVMPDTVISYLPYSGRAFQATYGQNRGVLNTTLTAFRYTDEEDGKGARSLTIVPQQRDTDIREMVLTIYDNGHAYLRVSFNQRQPVSYSGYIKP